MSYKLSAVLDGHSDDVRGLAAQGNDVLVSVSRDKTGRTWKRAGPNSFVEDCMLLGHSGAVTAVAMVPATADRPRGLIATGGQDKTVCLWDPEDLSQPAARLLGHTDNVCALTASRDGRIVVSGSWDNTAKVWVDGECKHTLREHKFAVWGVLVLDDGSVVTASADKLIRRWQDGVLKQTYIGHTDCVRALAHAPGGTFASASNDGSIRIWDLDGTCRAELYGHTSFVYSLDTLPDGALVSGGEDRSVRIWRNNELEHTILVPSVSVWSVAALANGDVACGTNDGKVRVFSQDPSHMAPDEVCKEFEEGNASFAMSAQAMGGMDTSKLPGPERLESPGTKDQQVIMVKDGTAVTAYQWEQSAAKWSKVGEVVDAVGQSQKQVFEGKEYDYVFDVDIQEGAPRLKLPFNASENPYTAAQRFLERNELSMDHLDTVANFIVQNASGVQLGAGQSQPYADPFTGGNRYVPGRPAGGMESSGRADPFTGGSRYTPSGASASAPSGYVPPSEFIVNKQGNGAAIVKKLSEFNDQLAQDSSTASLAIGKEDFALLRQLEGLGTSAEATVPEAAYRVLVESVQRWPWEKRFPGLDLIRLAIAASPVPLSHHTADGKGLVAFVGETAGVLGVNALQPPLSKIQEINAMMGIRALANACANTLGTPKGMDIVWESRKSILQSLDGSWTVATNKNLITALSNLYLNLAIAATHKGDDDQGLDILSAASRFLNQTDNADAQLRLVNVFGVLAAKFQLCKDSARVLGDETIVILGIQGKTSAVKQAAKEVGSFLAV
ncbi:WD repeat protein Lub1 [Coemansia sp. RSA 552]|nr:WD repeat protein Lub1 [Coemansia sp. RSA 552]